MSTEGRRPPQIADPLRLSGRWHGIDAARGLALVGMFAAHTWPRNGSEELLVDGRSSVLFAVVAGVALGLVTGADAPWPERRGEARVRLLIRAAVLAALGLLLWMLPSGIAIILDYYGLMFVAMVPVLFAPRAVLVVMSAVVIVIAPLVRDVIVASGKPLGEPWITLTDYAFTGYYPVLLWLPFLSVGLLCARAGLSRPRVRWSMVGFGAAAAIAGYGSGALVPGLDTSAHSGSTAELLGAGGVAVALIGLALVVLDPKTPRRAARVIASPLSALGRIPLTVYTAHVLVIAALAPLGPAGLFDAPTGIALFAGLSLGGIVVALLWQRWGRRGPLEWLVASMAGLPYRHRAALGERAPTPSARVPD